MLQGNFFFLPFSFSFSFFFFLQQLIDEFFSTVESLSGQ